MNTALRITMILFVVVQLAGCAGAPRDESAVVDPADLIAQTQPTADGIERAVRRGVDFMLTAQNSDGSWGSATRTTGIDVYAPVPGSHHSFRMACTALGVMALIELDDDRPEAVASLERAEQYIMEKLPHVKRPAPRALYNVWAHAYAIRALARMHDRTDDQGRRARIVALIESQVALLHHYRMVQGGWGYYEFSYNNQRPGGWSMSFTTGTVMIALHEARQRGVEIPTGSSQGGLRCLRHCQLPDGAFIYADSHWRGPRRLINRHTGSLARSQVCHLAMRLWGEPIENAMLRKWLDLLFKRLGWLDMARKKPIPHESFAANSGYFFYYGMFYASGCIEQLNMAERPAYRNKLAAVLLALQEKDGSWWDYPLYNYHQPYGTAYALLCLATMR